MAQPKETKRMLQVGELVKRNISIVLQQEGSYYYGTEALVTVTSVKMSSDMGIAKVYLSIYNTCLLYTSPSPRDRTRSRMPSSA